MKVKMRNISEIKEYPWIFSLLSGVFAIISLLTPSSARVSLCPNPTECCAGFCWQWGLELGGGTFGWVWQPYLIVGLFTAILFFAGALIMLITGFLSRRREEIKFGQTWSAISKVILAQIILFIIYLLMRNFEYFDYHTIGFGIIGPFFSAAFAIIAARLAS